MDEPTSRVRTLGRYQVLEELGRGAMGIVYKGFDPVIGRTVALKTLIFDTSEQDSESLRQRLYREACAAGTLTHQNIVTVYDVLEEGGTTAVAMEFIEGQTLTDVITARAPLALDAALDIFEQVCTAIDYAGSHGIVHRDIKPANVMLTSDGRVKVADFGVARMEASTMTQTGLIMGSPSYMSPEQVRGQELDTRSDLFSATVVLYELLTAERPFSGDDVATTLYRIVHEPPVPPSSFNAAISETVTGVIQRGLAKEPNARFRSGAELCGELRRAMSGVELPLADEVQISRRPSPIVLAGGGATVVVLLLVGLSVMSGGSGEDAAVSEPPVQVTEVAEVAEVALPAPESAPAPPRTEGQDAETAGAAPPSNMPVATIPPVEGAGPSAVASAEPAAAPTPEPAPPAEPDPPAVAPATLRVRYAGDPFAVALLADDERLGVLSNGRGSLEAAPGSRRLRAVSSTVFLRHDFGEVELEAGGDRTLSLPALASAFVGVVGETYGGLEISIGGAALPGPYPAQLPRIAVGRHAMVFRWNSGGLAGLEIRDVANLREPGHYLIRAAPETSQITVQKVR